MADNDNDNDNDNDTDNDTDRPAAKSATKRSAAKKTAKKSATKKSASRRSEGQRSEGERSERSAPRRPSALQAAQRAARQLTELTGRESETVIGVHRTEDGWTVEVEVVESRRIPDSTDVLATYEVEVDEQGELTGYRRARRYIRGKGGDGRDGSR